MVEIAEGETIRPERVIGFVESEFEAPGGERLEDEKRDRPHDRPAGEASRMSFSSFGAGDDGSVPQVVALAPLS